MKKLAIFGASGFAREVRDIAVGLGCQDIIFIGKTAGKGSEGLRVVADTEVYSLRQAGYKFTIGIGSTAIRKEISERYPDLNYVNLIHPAATFGYAQLPKVERRVGNIICAGTRLTSNISIGNFGIYNLNCTIGHDCIIEDFVTVSPGANISGNVKLSTGAYIGTNASILQGASLTEKLVIGSGASVGAGAVVTKNVPNNTIVKGVPAR